MNYSHEVEKCVLLQGLRPRSRTDTGRGEMGKGKADYRYFRPLHGVGWCAPQQGACKLTLNVKNGIIEERSSRHWAARG